jgi:glycosyltransferase involved in cell wall biosynthesis
MKILYLCHDPIPSPETRTEQLVHTMAALAPHGIDCTLMVPASFPEAPLRDRKAGIRRFYGLPADCAFPEHLFELGSPRSSRAALGRLFHDLRAVRRARSLAFDLLYTRDELAMLLSVRHGLPTIFETYRPDLNVLRRFWIFRRLAYSRSHLLGIVTHSRYAWEAFLAAGVEPARVHLGYNGFDPGAVLPALSREEARARLGLPAGATIVAYTGHVEARKGTSSLLPIAALLPEVHFLVVGALPGSPGQREFVAQRDHYGLDNVELVPRVSPPEVPVFLYAADCLIIPPTSGPLERHRRTVLPMKTFTYMGCGRPILAPDLPDVREVLVDDRNSVLVRPDRPREAADALRGLFRNPDRASRLARQAQLDSDRYTWNARAADLAVFLRERLAVRPSGAAS